MINAFRIVQYLFVLVIVSFVWGCAVPPATAPVVPEEKPSVEISKKKKQQVKVRKKEKSKKRKAKKVQSPEVTVEMAEESLPEESPPEESEASGAEPVVGRMLFHYSYYPGPQVYFDTIRHLYFYNEDGRWIMSVALPTSFQEKLGEGVRLKLRTDQPYTLHKEHKLKYPSADRRRLFD